MTPEDNKDVIRRIFEAVGRGDMDAVEALLADDLVEHEEFPGLEPNKDGVIRFFTYLRSAFPDLEVTAHHMLADGDLVAMRGTMKGTHQGEFMDIPATGNRLELPFADFFRLEGGKVTEHWGVTDTHVMMTQLGVLEE